MGRGNKNFSESCCNLRERNKEGERELRRNVESGRKSQTKKCRNHNVVKGIFVTQTFICKIYIQYIWNFHMHLSVIFTNKGTIEENEYYTVGPFAI